MFSSPVPWYSCDWPAKWQMTELLEGTLLLLAFIRRSVTVDGGRGLGGVGGSWVTDEVKDEGMVQDEYELA